jgi:SnoaL-like domain
MEAYRAAWISNVPSEVAALFTEDAVYSVSPFTEPWIGRDEIVRRWIAGIQQDVELTYDVLAADADQAIIHWHVFTRNVGDPVRVEYDGVLVVRFAPDGRCSEHREWYFRRELPG